MTNNRDSWQLDAGHRLRQHLMRAVTKGKNFAPDQTYELSKAGRVGPVSAQISAIFQRHANLWAENMRESKHAGVDFDADAAWSRTMAQAELEVGRFLAGHKLTSGAAA